MESVITEALLPRDRKKKYTGCFCEYFEKTPTNRVVVKKIKLFSGTKFPPQRRFRILKGILISKTFKLCLLVNFLIGVKKHRVPNRNLLCVIEST